MILDADMKAQLQQYMELLEDEITLKLSVGDDKASEDITSLVEELAALSPKITIEHTVLDRTPSFSINRADEETGVTFAGLPLGHEFTSLVLALLQVSGRAPKIDEDLAEQIKNLDGEYHFDTYVSLSCQVCPEVVQALNIMTVLNPNITHTMVDGGTFKEEVESKKILAVPTIYLNGEEFNGGRITIPEILAKLGSGPDAADFEGKDPYDVLVVGGGPGGVTAAIYAARKGIRTGLVAERLGGQVLDTADIENFISVKKIEGPQLAANFEAHLKEYDIDVMELQRVKNIEKKDYVEVELENGAILKSKAIVISTGANWRKMGIPGETEYKNKGVAYCPHCDGPLFEGKHVAVVGGGNSGVEAAIDLSVIVDHVTILERNDELRADKVLQDRLAKLKNVTVIKNAKTTEITGTDIVDGLTYEDLETGEEKHLDVAGVFVQIGLVPSTSFVDGLVDKNDRGEIIVDKFGRTNVAGIFAAGDCTDSAYNQIIISMGDAATASLTAYDYTVQYADEFEKIKA